MLMFSPYYMLFFYSLFALYVWIVFICFSKHLFDEM